jgi:hypothetical protein
MFGEHHRRMTGDQKVADEGAKAYSEVPRETLTGRRFGIGDRRVPRLRPPPAPAWDPSEKTVGGVGPFSSTLPATLCCAGVPRETLTG